MLRKILHSALYLAALTILTSQAAFASYLTISGNNALQVNKDDTGLTISGTIEIRNSGDEEAHHVRPVLSFGKTRNSSVWSGDPQDIEANQSYTWNVDYKLSSSELSCTSPECAEIRGTFPLFVKYLYEDANSYKFSAPNLLNVTTPNLTDKERMSLSVNKTNQKMLCTPEGKNFNCTVTVISHAMTPLETTIQLSTADELLVTPEQTTLTLLPSSKETTYSFTVSNFSALMGSSYPLIATIQWKDGSVNNVASAIAVIKIEEIKSTVIPLVVGILALIVLGLTIYLVRLTTSRKKTA